MEGGAKKVTADLEITKGVTEDKCSSNALLTEGPATPLKIQKPIAVTNQAVMI